MLRRPNIPKITPTEEPPIEYVDVPVRVVQIAVDGLAQPLMFYLESADTLDKTDPQIITITQGSKVTEVPRSRVLIIEEFPHTKKRKKDYVADALASKKLEPGSIVPVQ